MIIAVIDYGMGNLRSAGKALERVAPQAQIVIANHPDEVNKADCVVFPGQGAMPDCMREMDARGLREAVCRAAREKPFLGICIGLQMLFDWSEEGNVKGLSVLSGAVRRFPAEAMHTSEGMKLKVPHMGWNQVKQMKPHPLWQGIPDNSRYYFVHSYYPEVQDRQIIAASSEYGLPFTCACSKDNIFAVQFHPEKSAIVGLTLLKNFVAWKP